MKTTKIEIQNESKPIVATSVSKLSYNMNVYSKLFHSQILEPLQIFINLCLERGFG